MINPLIFSVLILTVLCLFKVNVMISIIISGLLGGLVGGLSLTAAMEAMLDGMGDNVETALSYVLLGVLAASISETSIVEFITVKISRHLNNRKYLLLFLFLIFGTLSQTILPVHIAWIPIVIPPILVIMNSMKLDRRAVACNLTFSMKWSYFVFPVGFGFIFHSIVSKAMTENGLPFKAGDVWKAMIIPAIALVIGWLISIFISYRKPRDYEQRNFEFNMDYEIQFKRKEWFAIFAIVVGCVVQILTQSMPLGCIAGIIILLISGNIDLQNADAKIAHGIRLMGSLAFIMLVAGGFAKIIIETGSLDTLVASSIALVGNNKFLGALVMLLIGLAITMGIGTSFGTIPIIATLYVPFGLKLGFSPLAIACLVGTAGALGDAGAPASDITMGPTSGLNADKQHNHIWDTCVPTFLHFNIPLLIAGLIAAMIL
ncbi:MULTISPECIES: Na+/H+ antiporter family protein [unclassified Treponema]|uniref:Na+/H+ antiporter family protein n=1 Tax=unclassified Treponema TaxID=2638727 RepID=UPI0020A34514|nr:MULTISPECIES: Na+/H+ antiporter NhaC family protein [unclassified Treponema]UTC67631.1 sodium:proton antiporter [Treponema sp. OMZ 789]UTC70359.1 sodium:proton antiporter [Treponema sp. OMZ 790]UTC73073.1 sodium:proton antiporter [Treponema sp. OMZ 791]